MERYSFKKTVKVDITEVDYIILKRLADFQNITIAHALATLFSGFDLYSDWIIDTDKDGNVAILDSINKKES